MTVGQWQNSREVVERIAVRGTLRLETPARFGEGDGDGLVDMPLLLDPLQGYGLLSGASLAGALSSYLREREHGFGRRGGASSLFARLFGGLGAGEDLEQSALNTFDALTDRPVIELRDGVAIDPQSRTAEDSKKFDFELLEAGMTFPIRVELLVTEPRRADLVRGLAMALQGLERGEIGLGARKRRGLGACRVTEWAVRRYDICGGRGLLGWLQDDPSGELTGPSIAPLLGLTDDDVALDSRRSMAVLATFAVDGSLLIRSGLGGPGDPDSVHLRSRRSANGAPSPILSGTALAGALRARALRIAKLARGADSGRTFVDKMFGVRPRNSTDAMRASRLVACESDISNPLDLVHTRVKIDRFTGAAYPGALFSEQPVYGRLDGQTQVVISLALQQFPDADFDAQAGLLLLLVKDLWTGDLPLGGEVSVGRGRLRGINAEVRCGEQRWGLARAEGGALAIQGDRAALERYVQALWEVKP